VTKKRGMSQSVAEAIAADEQRTANRKLAAQIKEAQQKRDRKAAEVERYRSARNVWPEDSVNYKSQNAQFERHSEILARYEEELDNLQLACTKTNCSADTSKNAVDVGKGTYARFAAVENPNISESSGDASSAVQWWIYMVGAIVLLFVVLSLIWYFGLRTATPVGFRPTQAISTASSF